MVSTQRPSDAPLSFRRASDESVRRRRVRLPPGGGATFPGPVTATLFSIKREYADAILDGSKRMEIRKTIPPVLEGDVCLLYVTAPTKRVVGAFECMGTIAGEPAYVRRQAVRLGVPGDAFDAYVSGARQAVGIRVGRVVRCAPFALPLPAPRSFMPVREDDPLTGVLALAAECLGQRLRCAP